VEKIIIGPENSGFFHPNLIGIPQRRQRREYFSHSTISKSQRIHFYLLDILPLIGSIISVCILSQIGLSKIDVLIFLIVFIPTVVGIELGYHRYFSHHAFNAHPALEAVLNILGAMGGQGPAIAWASNHRHHHKYSDREGDTHSPHLGNDPFWRRFLHSHLLWKYQYRYPNPAYYTPMLVKNDSFNRIDRLYYFWVVLGVLIPGFLGILLTSSLKGGLTAFLFAGVIRLSFGQHLTWCINSLCHTIGHRDFETEDQSRNLGLLALITLGGSWHNNHHAFPNSAKNSYRWWQIDLSYWILMGLVQISLASNVRLPSPEIVEKERIR
jgi:stearoyl-CoA desaturase (Delta-9 desaturase)